MLDHPTLDLLHELGLQGMAHCFREIAQNPEAGNLQHGEWLAILLEHEPTWRRQKRFEARARTARLRNAASVEDIDYHAQRGLDRVLLLKLCGCDWARQHRNLLVTGPTGTGKSWIACALGHKACRENLSVLYQRVPRLMAALALARGDGRYAKLLRSLARVNLLILDDWGPEPLAPEQRRDLLEYPAGFIGICTLRTRHRQYPEALSHPTPRWPPSTSTAPSSTVNGTIPSHQMLIPQIARLSGARPFRGGRESLAKHN
jgi:DNA replication protein DnaC